MELSVCPEGAQGICHPGSGDGGLPDMLASFLPLVPEHHVDEDDGYAQDVGYQEENTQHQIFFAGT